MRRLDLAYRSHERLEEFHDAAQVLGDTAAWVNQVDDQMRQTTSVRHLLPAHYSTAGAEAAAHRLRNLCGQRSFSLRNATRTNLLLGLTRLHLTTATTSTPTTASCARSPQHERDGRARASDSTSDARDARDRR